MCPTQAEGGWLGVFFDEARDGQKEETVDTPGKSTDGWKILEPILHVASKGKKGDATWKIARTRCVYT
jgi:hypothetical protein